MVRYTSFLFKRVALVWHWWTIYGKVYRVYCRILNTLSYFQRKLLRQDSSPRPPKNVIELQLPRL